MKIEQAVIFCGGRGERLRPLTDDKPKPMVDVNGKPFLDYLLYSLQYAGVKRVLLLLGYKGEVIYERYRNLDWVDYSWGLTEDMTGRRVVNAYDKLDEHFLLCYGDTFLPEIPLERMKEHYGKYFAPFMTTVFNNYLGTGEYGHDNNVQVNNDGYVLRYDKTRKELNLNGVDIGYFLLDKTFIDKHIPWNFSFEEKIIAESACTNKLTAYITNQQYHWITDMNSLSKFELIAKRENFKTIDWRK